MLPTDPHDLADGLKRILMENVMSKIAKYLGGKLLGEGAGRWLGNPAGKGAAYENIKKAVEKLWDKFFWAKDAAARDAVERIRRARASDPMEKILGRIPLVGAPPGRPPVEPAKGPRR